MKKIVFVLVLLISTNVFAQHSMDSGQNSLAGLTNIFLNIVATPLGAEKELKYCSNNLLSIIRKDYARDRGPEGVRWVRENAMNAMHNAIMSNDKSALSENSLAVLTVKLDEYAFNDESKKDYIDIQVELSQPTLLVRDESSIMLSTTWKRSGTITNFESYEATGFIRDKMLEILADLNKDYVAANPK